MSIEHVNFKKVTQSHFDNITPDDATFYRVSQTGGDEDVYLGDEKLNAQSPYSVDAQGYLSFDYDKI